MGIERMTGEANTGAIEGLGVPVSKLVLGTMTFGDTADRATAAQMFDLALESGINTVDTANVYMGGTAEEIVGELLRSRREHVVLASKAGMPHADLAGHSPLSPKGLRNSIEGSLRRLGVERLDLFYLHQPDRTVPLEATLATVADFVSEGKLDAFGVSNFSAWQIGDIIQVAQSVGAPRPVVAQQLYNLVARRVEDEYLEFAASHGIYTMVYNPLGGGLLTGQYSFQTKPSLGRFGDSKISAAYTNRYWDERLFAAVGALTEIARNAHVPPAELALRWLAFHDGVGSVLVGGSKVEQLRANIAAVAAGPLPQEVLDACNVIGAELRGPMPAYNR